MTRAEMMTLATALVAASGLPYVTTTSDQNTVANRRMGEFAAQTECLYSEAVTFTLQNGVGIYDLRGNQFASRVYRVDAVTINKVPLRDYDGSIGLTSINAVRQQEEAYLATPNGMPLRAWTMPGQQLRIWPSPDQVYGNSSVAGVILPADIDITSGGDSTALAFAPEICETVAVWVAVGLLLPTSATDTDYERMRFFSQAAADRMQALIAKTESLMGGPSVRGEAEGSGYRRVCLG